MTKYFKSQVTLQKTFQINVAAENESAAREKATNLALQEIPGSCIARIEITPDGETEYGVGVKVKHFIFGQGEIIDLSRTTNFKNEIGFRATIKFETGDVKDIGLPMSKDKLEVIQ